MSSMFTNLYAKVARKGGSGGELLKAKPLRPIWQAAKKQAEALAKAASKDAEFKQLDKAFSAGLGKALDKWVSLYPDFPGMEKQKQAIAGITGGYYKLIAAADTLPAVIREALKEGLDAVGSELELKSQTASMLIDSNVELAIKESKKAPVTPIVIFRSNDISPQVTQLGTSESQGVLKVEALPVEVLLTDKAILKKVGENNQDGNLAQQIKDAADFARVIIEIASAYDRAAAMYAQDERALIPANNMFAEAVQQACRDAADRGSAELARLIKVRSDYRMYKIKTGANLAMAVTGTFAGAISLGLAPFTFGASMIITAIGVAKGAVEIGRQLADIASSAEMIAAELKSEVKSLLARYEDVKRGAVGTAEMAVTLLNAVTPTFFKTIKNCNSNSGLLGDKINGLEVKAGDLSTKLNELLDAQEPVVGRLRAWESEAKAMLSKKEAKAIEKLFKQLDKSSEAVAELLEKIPALNSRVRDARTDHDVIAKDLAVLSAREPTWAKVGEVLIQTGANVGFLVAANVGWPDAYKIAETTKAVVDGIGNAVGSLDGAKSLIEEAVDAIQEAKKPK